MRLTIILVITLVFLPVLISAKSSKQFDKEINSKTRDLKNLQQSINEKQAEKERCLLEEKLIKSELRTIEQALSSLQKKSETIRRGILEAEKKFANAVKDLNAANFEKQQWLAVMNKESALWYKKHRSIDQIYSDPIEEKLRLSALRKKKEYVTGAEQREINSQKALDKWTAAKRNLLDLKVKQEQNISEQEKTKSKKKELLKTATGRRIVAEDEEKMLKESAKALGNLIVNLEKEKELTLQDELLSKQAAQKRREYPWPVEGKVVTYFGKSKHPELDTYVISNGIKIHAAAGTDVKPISKGEIMFTGEFRSYGQMIIIDHGGSLYSIYGQLGEITVEEGRRVKDTDVIGRISKNKETLLYFEVKYKGKSEDPLKWLK
ncbi:MAG: peptidoglycan DD-metalloendopeptidase family protein [Elusimicrobiota bacterium]